MVCARVHARTSQREKLNDFGRREERPITDDDRRRLAKIASKVRRGVRHPDLIAVLRAFLPWWPSVT